MGKSNCVLGIGAGHGDSAAALIVGDMLVAAAEEERFTRTKHCALFPFHAVRYCLEHAGVRPAEVDIVAWAKKPFNQWRARAWTALRSPRLFKQVARPGAGSTSASLALAGLTGARLVRLEHHLAHMMSVRLLAQDQQRMALLSVDGLGDGVSTALGEAGRGSIRILKRRLFPHSLGFFYTALTQYLGFSSFGDEFKVMGLSSYGQPSLQDAMDRLLAIDEDQGFSLNLQAFPLLQAPGLLSIENAQPKIRPLYDPAVLEACLGVAPRRAGDALKPVHYDLAASIQARFEMVGHHLLRLLHRRVPVETVGVAGGCAHNSVWVGRIRSETPFKRVLVPPAAHDAGLAVGAAAFAAGRPVLPQGGHWGLLGPEPEPLPRSLASGARTFPSDSALIEWMVRQLCRRSIVGLVHGRMEFGPRALGNRSLLADPRDAGMKSLLNEKIKHREPFRPFAASVLVEHQSEWFAGATPSPYMETVCKVKAPQSIPAITHVDGTCRIQSVSRASQPFYWALIEGFRKATGVPLLLNTSFNDNEPIVCTSDDALRCFESSQTDCLVIGRTAWVRAGIESAERENSQVEPMLRAS